MNENPLTLARDKPLGSLMRALAPFRSELVISAAIFFIKDSPIWLLPTITAAAVDIVVKGGPLGSLGWLAVAACALLLQNYPTHVIFTRLYMGSVRALGARLRNEMTARLQTLSIGFHARASSAVMQNKVVRDVENIEVMFSQIGNPTMSAVFVFGGAVVMTAVNVPEFLPVYALSVPCGVGVWWLMRRRARARNEEFRLEMERFSSRVGEMTTLIPITRAHGLEDVAAARVAQAAENVRSRGLSLDLLNGRFNAASWIVFQLLAVGCLLLAAAFAVLHWVPISPGQVVLLATYFSALTGTVTTVLNLAPLVSKGSESVRSLAELMEEPDRELNEGKRVVTHVTGRIELRDVSVVYPESPSPALDGISLEIEAGMTIAFVGPSGSGKSSLMNTVLGFVRPSSGTVLLDGVDMNTLDLRGVRRHISVVPQESILFEGTVRENITYGLERVDDARVMSAVRDANALDIIKGLPSGWNTVIGERGARLSGGQRQRLSIARALIRDPQILLLDEATSALDSESEIKIQAALEGLTAGRTTLVVAHRLSTVKRADAIVVLENGRIVQTGTHAELLATGGRYADLWGLQAR
ncbi:ABC transporter ATP-binding protein [Gryllotalpicola reticulitermitis]|uniref:ABC transporter ATP-binding protein n=1 Tax=Gryllotalpicola reticulitermitis TaxID=1184153 RepID=A0ABV8Q512_9MICO